MTQAKAETVLSASRLAAPTDLTPVEVRTVTGMVNPLIADALALYIKTKNYHWHLSGPHARDYHLLVDEQADAILGSVDILAERVRKRGGAMVRSISHVSEMQTLPDGNDDFVSAGEMARRLLDDNRRMAEAQRNAHKVCDRARDAATAGLLEDIIDETERRIWFLYEIYWSDEKRRSPNGNASRESFRESEKSGRFLYANPEGGQHGSRRLRTPSHASSMGCGKRGASEYVPRGSLVDTEALAWRSGLAARYRLAPGTRVSWPGPTRNGRTRYGQVSPASKDWAPEV